MIEAHRTKSKLAHARAGMATLKGVGAEEAFLRKKAFGNSDNIRFAVANFGGVLSQLLILDVRVAVYAALFC